MEEGVLSPQGTEAALKVTLGDLIVFINWMQQAERALDQGEGLPSLPAVDSDQVRAWTRLVEKLQARYRQGEDRQMALEANLQSQEHEVARLLSHLHDNIASLYENLGQNEKAQEVRRRSSSIQSA